MGKYQTHRADENAQALYDYLTAHGAAVERIGRPLDALVEYRGEMVLVDVKGPKGRFTPAQQRFTARWRGRWAILRTEADCVELLRVLRTLTTS